MDVNSIFTRLYIHVDGVLGQEENFKAEFCNCRKNNIILAE